MGDAPGGLGRLDDHQSGTRKHQSADMDEVPWLRRTIDGTVLTHRGHHDAVI